VVILEPLRLESAGFPRCAGRDPACPWCPSHLGSRRILLLAADRDNAAGCRRALCPEARAR
jgi:hypothetical protein